MLSTAACAADLLVPQYLDMVARSTKPSLREANGAIVASSGLNLHCEGRPPLRFTENETNNQRLFGTANASPYVKDGINDFVVSGGRRRSIRARRGTKAAAHYHATIDAGDTAVIRLRLNNAD